MASKSARYHFAVQLPHENLPIPHARSSGPADALEATGSVRSTLRRLAVKDRHLLLMYYADGLTLREIGCVLHISESAAGLRRKTLIVRLRQAARASQTKQKGYLSWRPKPESSKACKSSWWMTIPT